MKKSIFYLMFFLPLNSLAGDLEISEIIAYGGTISNKNIIMTLSAQKGNVSGDYFYSKYKVSIPLHGSISDSKLHLVEKTLNGDAYIDAEKKEGTIDGTWELNGKAHKIHAQALSKSYEDIIKGVDVTKQDDPNKTLNIIFKNGINQSIDISTLEDSTLIIFEDFTFDGYPDMRVLELEAGGNSSFIYFEYDVTTGTYVNSSAEIRDLVNPRIIHSENTIMSTSRDGCCVYYVKKILPKESHFAIYDFESKSGHVTITNKATGDVSTKPIGEDYFEDNYLSFTGSIKSSRDQ